MPDGFGDGAFEIAIASYVTFDDGGMRGSVSSLPCDSLREIFEAVGAARGKSEFSPDCASCTASSSPMPEEAPVISTDLLRKKARDAGHPDIITATGEIRKVKMDVVE